MDETTGSEDAVLFGEHVRLEPLTPSHTDGLVAAANAADPENPPYAGQVESKPR